MKSARSTALFYLLKRRFANSYFAAGGVQKQQISLKDHYGPLCASCMAEVSVR